MMNFTPLPSAGVALPSLPEGAVEGDRLILEATATGWRVIPLPADLGIPEGGTVGQVLVLTEDGLAWSNFPADVDEVPDEGTPGWFLTKTSDGTAWTALPDLVDLVDRVDEAEGDIETLFGNIETIGLPSAVDIIYLVPQDYPTINAAVAAARLRRVRPGVRVYIRVADGVYDESLSFAYEDLSYVRIEPQSAPVEHTTSTGLITVAGAVRAWSVTIPVANADTHYAVGDYVFLWAPNTVGNASPLDTDVKAAICGFWPVTAVGASSITVANTASNTLSAVTMATLKICRCRVKVRGKSVVSAVSAKTAEFKDIGIIDETGGSEAERYAVQIVTMSTLLVYQEPMTDAVARFRLGIFGHNTGLIARHYSLVTGVIAVSGVRRLGLGMVSGSRIGSRGLCVTGCAVDSAGPALYVEADGNIVASDIPANDLITVVAGNRGLGLSNILANVSMHLASLRGNSIDSYAGYSARSYHFNAPTTQIGNLSPAANTLGNNNSYINRVS